jgi:hypothetical protein
VSSEQQEACLDACAGRLAAIDMIEPLFFHLTSATLIE